MKSRLTQFLCTALFSAVSVYSIAAAADVETESFNLKEVKTLALKIDHAEITLAQGKGNELKVTLNQELKRGDEDVCLHKINHSSRSDSLEVYTEPRKRSNFANCNVKRSVHILLDQETIQNLHVKHSHGSFSADSFTPKKLSLDISHSKITLGKVTSDTVELDFNHGNLEIDTIAANEIEIKGSHGATHINEVSGEQLELKRSHGDVEINLSKVDQFTSRQSHGGLKLNAHQGTKLSAYNAHGGIAVNEGQVKTVELDNSHGSINYSGTSTSLRFSNKHGSTEIEQRNAEFESIEGKATHGSVELALPESSLCELDFSPLKKVSAEMFRKDGGCDNAGTKGLVKVRTTHGKVRINNLK